MGQQVSYDYMFPDGKRLERRRPIFIGGYPTNVQNNGGSVNQSHINAQYRCMAQPNRHRTSLLCF